MKAFALALALGSPAVRADDVLARAAQAYRAGDFAQAHALYTTALAAADAPHGEVLFHLGNCAYRLGRGAEALWHYRRAQLRLPRDAELAANLHLVEGQLGVEPPPRSLGSALLAPLDALGRGELLALACLLQTLGLAGCVLCRHRRRARVLLALVAAAGVAGAARAAQQQWFAAPGVAIVLADGLTLQQEPSADAGAVLTLRPGEALQLDAVEGDWLRVTHALGAGYVLRAGLGLVE